MLEEWNKIKMLPALNSITFTEDDENKLAKLNSGMLLILMIQK